MNAKQIRNAKHIRKVELEISRAVNANLDDSIDDSQIEHIVSRALARHMTPTDIATAFHVSVISSVHGEPIEHFIARRFRSPRHDN